MVLHVIYHLTPLHSGQKELGIPLRKDGAIVVRVEELRILGNVAGF
jgi:hypothetical protein